MTDKEIIAPYFYHDEYDSTQTLVRAAGFPFENQYGDKSAYERIVLEMDRSYIDLSVNHDTDEIVCKLVKERLWHKPKKYVELSEFSSFEGRELGWMWTGVNW